MKTQRLRALSAAFGGLIAGVSLASASTLTIPPQITSPAGGSTVSSVKPLEIRVDNGDLGNVHTVEILSNGVPIGWAYQPDFFGEWAFPAEAHLSVMDPDEQWWPDAPPVVIDYHPDGVSPMMFFQGEFVSPTQFAGTFETNDAIPQTGNVTVDFTRENGMITIVITGDAPIHVRRHTGGKNTTHRTLFTCQWATPQPGVHNLTARLTYTDPMTWEENVYTTAPVQVTVKAPPAPEIDVRLAGRSLKSGRSSTPFGRVSIGTKSKAVSYTIRNVGNAPLKNLKVGVKGTHAKDFVITQPRKSRIAAKAETTFKVSFLPKKQGVRKAQLQILSNDADENPFRVALQGTGK